MSSVSSNQHSTHNVEILSNKSLINRCVDRLVTLVSIGVISAILLSFALMFFISLGEAPSSIDETTQPVFILLLSVLWWRFNKKKGSLNLWRKIEIFVATFVIYSFWFILVGGPRHLLPLSTRGEMWLGFLACFIVLIPIIIVHAIIILVVSYMANSQFRKMSFVKDVQLSSSSEFHNVSVLESNQPSESSPLMQSAAIFCSQCGTRCKTSSNFCFKCGGKLRD